MSDHSKAFEITIAGLGIVLTAILGYSQYRLGKDAAQQRDQQHASAQSLAAQQYAAAQKQADDNVEIRMMELVSPHLKNLSQPGAEFAPSQKVVQAASEYLSSQYKRTSLAIMAAKISEGNASLSPEDKTRIQEATVPVAEGARWFAVLESLPPNDEKSAKGAANQRHRQVQASGSAQQIQLYRTRISNNYAIVLGGPVEKNAATGLAASARKSTLAKDAFAQQNRDWILIGTAPFAF